MLNKNDRSEPENQQAVYSSHTRSDYFEIRIKGQLDDSWSDWLEGLEVKLEDNGEMILAGHIKDQAALLGVLNKLYGLNLSLLSVMKTDQNE